MRRDDIDGLRALAVLPIVLYHLEVPRFDGGFVGVDIFFVISGFLITQRLTAGQSLGEFYERRARRILPALLLMLAAVSAAALVVLMPRDLASFGRSLLGTLLFVSNYQFWADIGYFDELAIYKPLLHTWSLAVEEQFYLMFPLFLVLCRKHLRAMLWPVLVLAVLSFALCVWVLTKQPSTAFYWLPFRGWELLIGAAVALWQPARRLEAPAALAGLGLILASVFGFTEATRFPGAAALLPCLGAALLIHGGRHLVAAPMRWAPLVFFGRISYSMYLWHWPVVVFYRYLGFELTAPAIAALFVLTTVLAWLSWGFVEVPVIERRALPRIVPAAVGAVAVGVLAAGVMLQGLPQRYPAQVAQLEAAGGDRSPDALKCHNRTPERVAAGDLCVIGDATETPTWLLWGDSHGRAMQDVFDAALRANGEAALVATRDGCIPLQGVVRAGYEKCVPFVAAVQQLKQARGLKPILVGHWTGYKDVHLVDGEPGSSEKVIARGLRRTPFAVVLDPIPGAPAAVPRALAQRVAYGLPERTAFTVEDFKARNALFFAATAGRQRVSLWKEICASGVCEVERGGRPLYFDSNHPAASSFSFAVPIVAEMLREARTRQDEVK